MIILCLMKALDCLYTCKRCQDRMLSDRNVAGEFWLLAFSRYLAYICIHRICGIHSLNVYMYN